MIYNLKENYSTVAEKHFLHFCQTGTSLKFAKFLNLMSIFTESILHLMLKNAYPSMRHYIFTFIISSHLYNKINGETTAKKKKKLKFDKPKIADVYFF